MAEHRVHPKRWSPWVRMEVAGMVVALLLLGLVLGPIASGVAAPGPGLFARGSLYGPHVAGPAAVQQ
ncbi:MAG: hypothetical protein HYU66_04315 [Armatimonadetes bacterium]|nr:hypothetical protein [Armatimonadota bacterium]